MHRKVVTLGDKHHVVHIFPHFHMRSSTLKLLEKERVQKINSMAASRRHAMCSMEAAVATGPVILALAAGRSTSLMATSSDSW
eukprot:2687881-Amphidinium_carterae.2